MLLSVCQLVCLSVCVSVFVYLCLYLNVWLLRASERSEHNVLVCVSVSLSLCTGMYTEFFSGGGNY